MYMLQTNITDASKHFCDIERHPGKALTSMYRNCAAAFANGTFGAAFVSSDGTWLGEPMAVLRATAGGKPVSALLRLSNPHYDAANNILTLGVRNNSVSLPMHLLPLFCSMASCNCDMSSMPV